MVVVKQSEAIMSLENVGASPSIPQRPSVLPNEGEHILPEPENKATTVFKESAPGTPAIPPENPRILSPVEVKNKGLQEKLRSRAASIFRSAPPEKSERASKGDMSPLTTFQMLSKPEREWAQEVMQAYAIDKNRSATGVLIKLDLPADKYHYYCTLQEEIASQIPEEHHRPIIDLRLRGSAAEGDDPGFGIIGGVGPLSDAAILDLSMQELQNTRDGLSKVKIDLYSSPPPRKATRGHFAKNIINYVTGLKKFLVRPGITQFCITSNTAHLNLARLQKWSGNKMVSLVEAVASEIEKDPIQNKNVLVLGTIEGYRGNLYSNVLNKKQIDNSTFRDEDEAETMQQIIDKVKRGENDVSNAHNLLAMLNIRLQEAIDEGTPFTHVLLGCTELPLVLSVPDSGVQAAVVALKETVKPVDSEAVFAGIIAKQVRQQE